MASKKDLKRDITQTCSALFAECVAAYFAVGKENEEQVDAIFTSILKTQSDFVRRVSHPEPGMEPKKYYRFLTERFSKQVGEIADNLQTLL